MIVWRTNFAYVFIAVLLTLLLGATLAPTQETPQEWWVLTLDLQSQAARIGNAPDRRFIREMLNKLAAKDDATPTLAEQFWLLSIRDELKKRK